MKSRAQTSLRNSLFVTAAGAALATGLALPSGDARADECILDTGNGEGRNGARADEGDDSLACGHDADAGNDSTALGSDTIAGNESVAVGHGAQANALDAVALGFEARANYNNTVAIGSGASANNTGGIAVGTAAATGLDGVAIGRLAKSNQGEDSIAIGAASQAYDQGNVVIGRNSQASGGYAIAIGQGAKTGDGADNPASAAIAIGYQAEASANQSVALGYESEASAGGSVALGWQAVADEANTVSVGGGAVPTRKIVNVKDGENDNDAATYGQLTSAINPINNTLEYFDITSNGTGASASGTDSLAIGESASVGSNYSLAIGLAASVGTGGGNNIALGRSASVSDNVFQGVAIGHGAGVSANGAVALGAGSIASVANTVSVGGGSTIPTRKIVNVQDGTADTDAATVGQIGDLVASELSAYEPGKLNRIDFGENSSAATADGIKATALGDGTKAVGDSSLAAGSASNAYGEYGVAIGNSATVEDLAAGGIAIGAWARVDGWQAIAMGDSDALADGAIAIGGHLSTAFYDEVDGAQATGFVSVALGAQANASGDYGVAIGALSQAADDDVLSVGNDGLQDYNQDRVIDENDFIQRRIVNMADGINDQDAVTMAQLNAVKGSGTTYMATSFDGNAASATGTNSFAVGTGALAFGSNSFAMGADVTGEDGLGAQAIGNFSTAIGIDAKANSSLAFALGGLSSATGNSSMAFGARATTNGAGAVAMGFEAQALRDFAMALGPKSYVEHLNSMAIGFEATTTRANQIMLGTSSLTLTAPGLSQIASNNAQSGDLYQVTVDADGNLGFLTTPISQTATAAAAPSNAKSTVLAAASVSNSEVSPQVTPEGFDYLDVDSTGDGANANGENAIALGSGAQAQAEGAIAIGFNSVASDPNTVSFGKAPSGEGIDDGITRRLVNVAEGIDPNDVVIKSQLDTATSDLDYIAFSNVGDAFGPASIYSATRAPNNNSIAIGPGAFIGEFANHAVAIGAGSVATEAYTVSFGSADDGITRKLTNVATGAVNEDSTDAVNGSQLAQVYSSIATFGTRFSDLGNAIIENLGAINTINANGTTYVATNAADDAEAATATGDGSVAIGAGALAFGENSFAMGADVAGDDGLGAQAIGNFSTAIGIDAKAESPLAFALGGLSSATGNSSMAFGAYATTNGAGAVAMGFEAQALRDFAMALGPKSYVEHLNSMAIGFEATTTRANQIMLGTSSLTLTMPGLPTQASNDAQQGNTLYMVTVDSEGNLGFATMPGTTSTAAPAQAAAAAPTAAPLASNASAPASSTAQPNATSSASPSTSSLAYDTTSTDGGPVSSAPSDERIASAEDMSSRTITDSEERSLPEQVEFADNTSDTAEQERGQLAQSDPDQNVPEPPSNPDTSAGTRTASTSATGSSDLVAAVTEEQFNTLAGSVSSLENRVSNLEGRVDSLFDLTETIDRDARRGIAAIAAQAQPHFPSEPGKTSYASNVATYRGEVGVSVGLMHRFEGDFAITAGVTYAGGNSTSVRAGVAGEF